MAGCYGLHGKVTPLTAASTTYLFGVVSGAVNSDGVIISLDVTFDNASSATGILIELFTATGGIPTATSFVSSVGSGSPEKFSSDAITTSAMASAWVNPVTVTPTGLTVMRNWYYNPAGGALIQWPYSREDYIRAGASQWFGVRVTTPTGIGPDCAYNCVWME